MPLPEALLAEVRRRFDVLQEERERKRIARGEPKRMGSYAEDEPYLHFLHADEAEQWRVAEEELGIDVEPYR